MTCGKKLPPLKATANHHVLVRVSLKLNIFHVNSPKECLGMATLIQIWQQVKEEGVPVQ